MTKLILQSIIHFRSKGRSVLWRVTKHTLRETPAHRNGRQVSSMRPRHRHYDHYGVARYLRSWAWNRTWGYGIDVVVVVASSSSSQRRLIRQGRPDQIGADHTSCSPYEYLHTDDQLSVLLFIFSVFGFFYILFSFFFLGRASGFFSH